MLSVTVLLLSLQVTYVANAGFLIASGEDKVLIDALMTRENFARHSLPAEGIDIAFIPYWYLLSEEGRSLVSEQVAPKRIVAIHVPPSELEDATRKIHTYLPDVVIFSRPGETRTF